MRVFHGQLVLVVFMSLIVGCAGARKSGLCEDLGTAAATKGDLGAAEATAEAAWKDRKNIKSLETAVASWREAIAVAPKKTTNYIKLAKALYLLGDGYYRFDEDREEEMLKALEEATFFSERALKIQNPDFTFSMCARDPFKKTLKTLTKNDVPAVYWYAVALGKYGLAKNIMIVLENKDRIYGMMRFIVKTHPHYWHGAAFRYLGAFHTKIPFPKGDPKKSKKYFLRSIKQAPNYLATRVLMAQMLAPRLKDRAMFKEQLEFVINAPVDIMPGLEAEHSIEKRKAKELLENIDDIFPPEASEG
jgi:tetratricopeptide (TPR) repeat protein